MWTNNLPTYQTQCLVDYKIPTLEEVFKKYGINEFPINTDEKNYNNYSSYIHTISKENITTMNENYARKQIGKLYNNVTKEEIFLNYPINFKIECDENGYYYISKKFNLYVYGETQDEAENNLVGAFKEQLELFAYEEDDKLDKNALILKRDLLEVYNNNA